MRTNRAVVIGTNYTGSPYELQGCENDAVDVTAMLRDRGYYVGTLLGPLATKANILEALEFRVEASRFGDRLVVWYSGHGSNVPDLNGDEPDGRDEVWCPDDFQTNNVLTDDDLNRVFSKKRFGVRITVFSDSCYSYNVTRFARVYDQDRTPKYVPPDAFLPSVSPEYARVVNRAYAGVEPTVRAFRLPSATVLHSGCGENELSWDAFINGRYNGAFTRTALDILQAYRAQYGKDPSNAEWHRRIRAELPSDEYPQSPQMAASLWQRRWSL